MASTPRRPSERLERGAVWVLLLPLILVLLAGSWAPLSAQAGGAPAEQEETSAAQKQEKDLTELNLEELLNVEVTSVSKKRERLFQTAAAVSVLSSEDIRRLGALSIAEALRAVAGVQVAQINSSRYAISVRGFNEQFANKLLVMIDGRSVYTPLFAGTWWDSQDTFLPDVDQIEVIRGPGATVWGANAVNGVINILTKSARDTLGGLAYGTLGTEEQGAGGLRYGFALDDNAWARFYVKGFNRDSLKTAGDKNGGDEWHVLRGGFRADWDVSENDTLTFSGDLYQGSIGDEFRQFSPFTTATPNINGHTNILGANLVGHWQHAISENSELALNAYWDHTRRAFNRLTDRRDIFNIDFHHRFQWGERQNIIWGVGYRLTTDHIGSTFSVRFNDQSRNDQLFSAFLQDEIALVPERLFLTLGSKLEHNDFSDFELQPSARLRWMISDKQMLWGAVSRAVRTPSRADHNTFAINSVLPALPGSPPTFTAFVGDGGFRPEELLALELGYRLRPDENVRFDLALFYNDYDHLRSLEPGAPILVPGPSPYAVLPFRFDNRLEAQAYGLELSAEWRATETWRLKGNYSLLLIDARGKRSLDMARSVEEVEGNSPQNQFHLSSFWNISDSFELDGALYFVDNLPEQHIPSYLRLDLSASWKPASNLRIQVGVQNILDDRHKEFGSSFEATAREAERLVFVTFAMSF